MNKSDLGIYIHVPFCFGKCPYCDFYSVLPQKAEEYVDAVCSEIKRWGKSINKVVDTIYFGGGTPSLLSFEHIQKILSAINNSFIVKNPEITVEVNPADYTQTDFKKLVGLGLNRVSVGAQSLEENDLKTLGRRHSTEDILKTCHAIQQAGIKNISMDLILGVPNQEMESIGRFLDFCSKNKIKHISAYLLKIEKGTIFYKNRNILNLPDDDESAEIYSHFCKIAKSYGYKQYEISNFTLSGFESKHNLKYWDLEDYLGVGPSAHSLLNGSRFYYENSLEKFLLNPEVVSEGKFEPEKEYAMLRSRLTEGLKNDLYEKNFGKSIPKEYFLKAKKYADLGFTNCDGININLTEYGFLLSNLIISDILIK